MSFHPLSQNGIATSLLGTGDPVRYINIDRADFSDKDLADRIHGTDESQKSSYMRTIMLIIISAIIFVTVVAMYDILRNVVNNYYAKLTLEDPNSKNSEDEIITTEIANRNNLISSVVFALITLLSAIVIIMFLINILKCYRTNSIDEQYSVTPK